MSNNDNISTKMSEIKDELKKIQENITRSTSKHTMCMEYIKTINQYMPQLLKSKTSINYLLHNLNHKVYETFQAHLIRQGKPDEAAEMGQEVKNLLSTVGDLHPLIDDLDKEIRALYSELVDILTESRIASIQVTPAENDAEEDKMKKLETRFQDLNNKQLHYLKEYAKYDEKVIVVNKFIVHKVLLPKYPHIFD